MVESAGTSARYHTQDGHHPEEAIFSALLPRVACVHCISKDGVWDSEFQRCLGVSSGGVGHDSQSVPGEIFARAHFHLIAEGQTSTFVEDGVEIM